MFSILPEIIKTFLDDLELLVIKNKIYEREWMAVFMRVYKYVNCDGYNKQIRFTKRDIGDLVGILNNRSEDGKNIIELMKTFCEENKGLNCLICNSDYEICRCWID